LFNIVADGVVPLIGKTPVKITPAYATLGPELPPLLPPLVDLLPPLEPLVLELPVELLPRALPVVLELPVELPLLPVPDDRPDEEADPDVPPPLLIPEPVPLRIATPDWQAQSPRMGSTAGMTALNDAMVAIILPIRRR
jgi:hypothetical protein